jgi:hypothetical protein
MEKIFIDTDDEKFVVHVEEVQECYKGAVYPICEWMHVKDKRESWAYTSGSEEGKIYFEEEWNGDCKILFRFFFAFRRVWEVHIFFRGEEYRLEDVKTVSELFCDEEWLNEVRVVAELWEKLEIVLKKKARQRLISSKLRRNKYS